MRVEHRSGTTRPTTRSWHGAAAILALAVLAAGCGAADSPADGAVVTVTMTDGNRFTPGTVTVPRGGTVVWRNTSNVVHTVTGSGFDSGNLAPGESYRRTFKTPGKTPYYCTPHRQAGMVGTVVVE